MSPTRRDLLQSAGAVVFRSHRARGSRHRRGRDGRSILNRHHLCRFHARNRRRCRGCGRARAVHRARSDPEKSLPAWRVHGDSRHGGRRGGRSRLARAHRPGAGTQHRPAPGHVRHCALGAFPCRLQHCRGRCRRTGCPRMDLDPDAQRPAYPGASSSATRSASRCSRPRTAGWSHRPASIRITSSAFSR